MLIIGHRYHLPAHTDSRFHPHRQRLVVFIDQDNAIQCYSYNEDIEEWEETPLGSKWNITTSSESKLSAILGPEGDIVVSYQDQTGRLAGIMSASSKTWNAFGPLKGDPVPGTPQYLEVIDDKLHLFYVEIDSGVSYLIHDPKTGNWTGESPILFSSACVYVVKRAG